MRERIYSETDAFHINIARLKIGGEMFEIDVDPDKALDFKNGIISDVHEVLRVRKIFSVVKRALLASEHVMNKIFKTSDPVEVAKIILNEGEIQLTEEHRKKAREEKRKRLIYLIHRNAVDPKTHLPHPHARIENAFEEAKIKIDEDKPADMQLQDVIKKLQPILPIRFEMKEIEIRIPPEYARKSYGLVKSWGKILKEDWLSGGYWNVVIEIPGVLASEFY